MGISTMEFERVMKIVKAYEGRIDKDFKIPPEEYEVRYRNVWKRLEEKEIDLVQGDAGRRHLSDRI